jgi:hypothetical protein
MDDVNVNAPALRVVDTVPVPATPGAAAAGLTRDGASPIGQPAADLATGDAPTTRSTRAERREALRRAKEDPDVIRRAFESGAYP